MSLLQLPSDAFASIFQHLNDEQVGRLYGTGSKLIQYRIFNTHRRCALSYWNRLTELVGKLLTTASDVNSDDALLSHLFALDKMPSSLRALTIEERTNGRGKAGIFDLRGLVNLHTFMYTGRYNEYAFVLPKSVTDLTICVSSVGGHPIMHSLGELYDLATLDISFQHESFESSFFDYVAWPESLTSLAYDMTNEESLPNLDKLPSTLRSLKLSSRMFDVCIPLTVPRQCASLTSLHVVGRKTPLPIDAWMPPSLTRIHASGLSQQVPGLYDFADALRSIPTHVTDLSFDGLGGLALNDVLAIGRLLLPRLSLEQLHWMTTYCAPFLAGKKSLARPHFNAAFLKLGLGKSYVSMILELGKHHGAPRYQRLFEFDVPIHYLDAYLSSPFGRSALRLYAVVVDNIVKEADWRAYVEWAFSRAGARQLQMRLEYLPAWVDTTLPSGVSANVEDLRVVLTDTMYLSSLLSSPLPKLETLGLNNMHNASPLTINDFVKVVYEYRHHLPGLNRISYGRLDDLTDDSVRMMAEMRLYEGECVGVLAFYASPPRRILQKYPFLVKADV